MKPNYHTTSGTWTGISPYGNTHVVYWSSAPRLARLRWWLQRLVGGKRYYRDPDSGRAWWA